MRGEIASDWYKTKKQGTYLIVPAGVPHGALLLPAATRSLLDPDQPACFKDVSSREMALTFGFLGVEDCLRENGWCLLRS